MNKRIFTNEQLGESYVYAEHPSGLKIYISEKPEYNTAYALFGTRYGSVDTKFRLKGEAEFTEVPEGIAHFLEHKLFESEEGDAFTRYAETGGYANAYTSFDRTCYLFSCSSRFEDNLAILLDFVQSPYFTAETVRKEQGIIGQEIRMYDDDAPWRVLFNLLCAMYRNHPVRIDIAGTADSIAKIDDRLLYKCYRTFYNLNNMFLCIAGKVNADAVLAQVEASLKDSAPAQIERGLHDEPRGIVKPYVEQSLAVSIPLFTVGFKEDCTRPEATLRERMESSILLELIAGKSSELYNRLCDEGLVNDSFGTELFYGYGYFAEIFEGESREPEKVRDAIVAEVERLRREGIDADEFARAKNGLYGEEVMLYNNVESVASALVSCAMDGIGLFDPLKELAAITVSDLEKRLESTMSAEYCALSVVKPRRGDLS